MRTKTYQSDYLAFLSVKHEIDPDKFFKALISAEEHRRSACGSLTIECRAKTEDKIVFLIQRDSKVIAQFPVPRGYLSQAGNPLKDPPKTELIRRQLDKKNSDSHIRLVRDLRAGMTRINLKATVVEIPKPTVVCTRYGNYASVANALIADETGTVRLCLWNDQIGSIAKGDTIHLHNARMSTFKGEKQLRIGKTGALNNGKELNLPLAKA